MGLETANFIDGLDESWPTGVDPVNKGDDHIRLVKDVLKKNFPGVGGDGFAKAITATEDELNFVGGATSNIQAQIDANDAEIAQNIIDIGDNAGLIAGNSADIADRVLKAGDTMTGALKGIAPVDAEDFTRKDYVDANVNPVGSILIWAMASAPSGYLLCNGAAVSRTGANVALFALLGSTYGDGNGSTTFNLPDYRGQFTRGVDGGAGTDPDAVGRTDRGDGTTGDNVGTKQPGKVEAHQHSLDRFESGAAIGVSYVQTDDDDSETPSQLDVPTGLTGGNETRPTNVYVNYIIKQ